jgi:SAM-dependent methyltransferase
VSDSGFSDVDAPYPAASARRGKSDAEFLATATRVVNSLESEIQRAKPEERRSWRALEIGCGSGRLMRPLGRHFLEIHGVDISEDLIAQARERLRDLPTAFLHPSRGAGLADLADGSFDFVYSCDFFPRLPSRELVLDFLRETHRILRPGGLARIECCGAAQSASDQWTSVGFTSQDLLDFAQAHDFQVLALDGVSTQSMWTTWRKHASGWLRALPAKIEAWGDARPVAIRRITNASSFEPVAPCRGRFASISLRVENLPPDAGLHHLRVTIGNSLGTVTCVGPVDRNGWQQIRVDLPELEATGLLPVQVLWLDRPLSEPATLRVIPPGPPVPRVISAPKRVENRIVSVTLEEIARPHEIEVSIGGRPMEDLEKICTDPRPQRYEVKFRLPDDIGPGLHHVNVRIGRRKLAAMPIEVA